MLDYVIITINCLTLEPSIDSLGMHAVFSEKSVQPAYYTAFICLIFNLIAALARGGNKERREQSVAMMPTTLSRKLRENGVISSRPSVPELQVLFNTLDKDGNGVLDQDELKGGLACLGCSAFEIDEMMRQADVDGDGKVTLVEFIAAVGKAV